MQIAGLEKTLMFDIEGTFLGEVLLCLNVNSQNLNNLSIFRLRALGILRRWSSTQVASS